MAWAPDYCTLAEAKAYSRITNEISDVQVALAVTAASRAVDLATNRQFGVVDAAEERFYTARYDRRIARWFVEVDDFMSTSGLVLEIDGTASTSFVKEPRNAAAKGRPWTRLVFNTDATLYPTGERDEIGVTALWGWSSVPAAVEQATLLQTQRFLIRRDSPYGIAGSIEDGSEIRLQSKVDPDVAVALGPYKRWWAVA